jgi:hypothetical protein
LLDCSPYLGGHLFPHQFFGEIDRWSNQHETGDVRGTRGPAADLARNEKRKPSAHGGAHEDLRATATCLVYRDAIFKPPTDGSVRKAASGLAVTRIVEPHDRAFLRGRPGIQSFRFGAPHIGIETAQPQKPRRLSDSASDSDAPLVRRGSNLEKFQATIVHLRDSVWPR